MSFVTARVLVLLALAVAQLLPAPVGRTDLLGWDAKWYLDIAQDGYDGVAAEGRRFFPALPLLVRFLGGGGDHLGPVQLLVVNLAALLYALLAHRVALDAGLSRAAADRVPWLLALNPAGFVLVMGYTESMFGVLLCVVLLASRRARWPLVAVAGFAGGFLRPTGVLLALPVLVEAYRSARADGWPGARRALRSPRWRRRLGARTLAVAAPVAGAGAYLLWCWSRWGSAWAPFTAQSDPDLRGGLLVNPWHAIADALQVLADGEVVRTAPVLHLLWVAVTVTLLVVGLRWLPQSYRVFTVAMVALALTAQGLNSFERYAASALPLLLIAAVLLHTPVRRRVALGLGIVVTVAYAVWAFLYLAVP
ncbi:hypothetical protein [Nakamurella leprariae]|uniref:Glycosyltransferase RgtA/B/C/D-like domain-containing protein n=1 Tax=Nakamurella leprariae TaxID=2803911 RepID=A0A938YGL5_9ACTN|nr:hypothetical protein [Nakamurella leprariae]MBM9468007.1 hypothetical protein [Nakamurella leprariae]